MVRGALHSTIPDIPVQLGLEASIPAYKALPQHRPGPRPLSPWAICTAIKVPTTSLLSSSSSLACSVEWKLFSQVRYLHSSPLSPYTLLTTLIESIGLRAFVPQASKILTSSRGYLI